ncbi:uncharacterized protein LOC122507569 [Leptopilina heterotoma]|uniref:uncharacterized protein LOC122507569 n=1 Tax=Leptopilina heterotoma TaxID=63436 RepID=UPI001CA92A70|nr:uncharacterized protein LOC122507569 [Leptopilina heterotoma]
MDAIKRERTALRSAFTKAHNGFQSKIADEAITKELESDDTYKTLFLTAKLRVTSLNSPNVSVHPVPNVVVDRKTMKLPSIELPKFSGNIKEWLPFWSQFKKINDDNTISGEDKYQYLIQATVPGSRANEIVNSFPPTGENFEKAVATLKSRFGRDDLLVEFYVRELLGLVLQNALKGNKRPASLASLYDRLESYIRSLDTLGVTKDKCTAMLFPLVESSLPEEILRAWQRSGQRGFTETDGQSETNDRLTKLLEFLRLEVESEERIDLALTGFGLSEPEVEKKPKGKVELVKDVPSANVLLVAKSERKFICIFCKAEHEKLCRDDIVSEREREYNSNSRDKLENEKALATLSDFPMVCLQTLRIELYSHSRKRVVRAVIDTASQRSYVRTDVAKDLQYIPINKVDVTHSLFGGAKSETKELDVFLIRMRNLENSFSYIDSDSQRIDVLIGADIAGKLLTGKKFVLKNGLTAFETLLGWTIIRRLPEKSKSVDSAIMITTMLVREARVTDLWNLDVIGITDPIEKLEKAKRDDKVWKFFINTAKLNQEARYEVRLPWVENHIPVSDNYDVACCRLKNSISKLKKQNLYDAYSEVFKEWLAENIIEIVPEHEIENISHYLPHRPVIKEEGTTAIRPVFDAMSCAKGFPSLNNCLEQGPNLIERVTSNLNRFREGEIGVVADIRKAFLQIVIHKSDRDFLRFLWMEGDKIITFRHCRVVFGLVCSPFLLSAILTLVLESAIKKTEEDVNCKWSKETIEKLKNGFYVDNCVVSVDSDCERDKFIREATTVLASGAFDLRGWESSGDCQERETTLVLGILWNKKRDTLSINPNIMNVENTNIVTKRSILAATHKIYDPLGIKCPVSLLPKLLIRKLWDDKVDWDRELENGKDDFLRWLKDLPILKTIEIPRKLGRGDLSLHVFGDASRFAYASVVFARIEDEGIVSVRLLNAKSRMAPKNATIPRLELMAATISVRLAISVSQALTRPISKITYWTDSTTVLAWIKRDSQWNTFVWNRVNEIRTYSKPENWRFICGELNPADLPSRGCSPSKLVESEWWLGPKWLYNIESKCPIQIEGVREEEIRSEMKKGPLVQMVNVDKTEFKPG